MTLYFWCDPGKHRIRTKVKVDESRKGVSIAVCFNMCVSIYCTQHKFEMRLLGSGHERRNK